MDAALGRRRFGIIHIIARETLLKVGWVSGIGRQFPVIELCLLRELLRLSQLLVKLLFLEGRLGASHSL